MIVAVKSAPSVDVHSFLLLGNTARYAVLDVVRLFMTQNALSESTGTGEQSREPALSALQIGETLLRMSNGETPSIAVTTGPVVNAGSGVVD